MRKTFITTAIPYVNAEPHIGFALEIIQADAIARYHRLNENEVCFLTGTDENSVKNVRAAATLGTTTEKLVNTNAQKFKQLKSVLSISFDDFIRTTEKRHIDGAKKFWLACKKDIYKKNYKGLYCVGCELFYKKSELIDDACPEHKTKPELVEEENYFFRLSSYQEKLQNIFESNTIKVVPEHRKNEILAFIRSGLEDFSISRSKERAHGWGIPIPDDPDQIMYVWFDALTNYINALGYSKNNSSFEKFWESDETETIHVIGKGVLRFHGIYWPAMLLSAGLRLPQKIIVHGYITVEGEKMSKSIGNVVNPSDVSEEWGVDPLRYFLLREIPTFEDGNFSRDRFIERYNADLAHGLGNLVSRSLTLLVKQESIYIKESDLEKEITLAWQKYREHMDKFKLNDALKTTWQLIKHTDRYINDQAPWKLLPDDKNASRVYSSMWLALAHIAHMLLPFMPQSAEEIMLMLGITNKKDPWINKDIKVEKPKRLFPVIH